MNTTLRIITYAVAILLGWLLASVFGSCNRPALPTISGAPKNAYIISTRHDTVTRDSIVYRDRWHTQTKSVVLYDTVRPIVESYPYIRQASATTLTDDTIDVTYHHPEGLFDIDFRPHPDTIRTVVVTNDSIVGVPDTHKWGIGFHAGIGGQWSGDGIIRVGVQLGVGINFNLWEP